MLDAGKSLNLVIFPMMKKKFLYRNLKRCHCYPTRFYKSPTTYIEEMYNSWLRDPTSVHRSWDAYFRSPPNLAMEEADTSTFSGPSDSIHTDSPIARAIDDHAALHSIIKSYQAHGYRFAKLDPLDTSPYEETYDYSATAVHGEFPFKGQDMEREFRLPNTTFIGGQTETALPLGEILKRLENVYCNRIGIDYMHLSSLEERNWIRKQFESPDAMDFSIEEQRLILLRLTRAVGFENFLVQKFPSEKRFSLSGCEALIPGLKYIIDVSSEFGVETFVFGLPERGRLNTLVNVCSKPLRHIFMLFAHDDLGDEKYRLGCCISRVKRSNNKPVRLSVLGNSAHLEAVNPVVQGKVFAEQFYADDNEGKKVLPILIHHNDSFAAQGIIYETMQLCTSPNYKTNGTIHFIVNNQVDTLRQPLSHKSHSSKSFYTDVSRVVKAPIFHVNADYPEAVVHVSKVAAEWRATFHRDVVIHLFGYSRHGGSNDNEMIFRNPFMLRKIEQHKPVLDQYSLKLIGEFKISTDEVQSDIDRYEEVCEEALEVAEEEKGFNKALWLESRWRGFFQSKDPVNAEETGLELGTLVDIGNRFLSPPLEDSEFVLHKDIHRFFADRKALLDKRQADWVLSEALAFGSLLKDGVHVRLSGQNVEHGLFSQRHHVLHHQLNADATYNALQNLYPEQATYVVANSLLSECAVLGFEHGYSLVNPNALVIWEAEFGDFANNGQCIIDQFIANGQQKWTRQSGLVMLLPHGLEGGGPDRSSARVERYLQMCLDDPEHIPIDFGRFSLCQLRDANWIVANCTTPANYFHILRRQIALPFRRPLVLFTPKAMLNSTDIISPIQDMCEEKEFQRLIRDPGPAGACPSNVKRVIYCSGCIYFELEKWRKLKHLQDEIAIMRVEQISPFPFDLIRKQNERYDIADLFWVQEEHKNQGAWSYVQPRFEATITDNRTINFIGRPCSVLTATFSKDQHRRELNAILDEAIALESRADDETWF